MQAHEEAALQELTLGWISEEVAPEPKRRLNELFLHGYAIYVLSDHIDKVFISSVPFSWSDLEHQWMWNVDGPEEYFRAVWRSRGFDEVIMRSGLKGWYGPDASHIYVVENKQHASVKVGISQEGSLSGRLRAHISRGWDLVGHTRPLGFDIANFTEDYVIQHFRECLGTRPSVQRSQMPQGGWTETVSTKNISAVDAWLGVLKVVEAVSR